MLILRNETNDKHIMVMMAFDEEDAIALKTLFDTKRFLFFVTCLKLLVEFIYITQVKQKTLIQNFSKIKNEIMSSCLRCLDIILIQQSLKILNQKGITVKCSEYLVHNTKNINEEKYFFYDQHKGMIFHGDFLSQKFQQKTEEIWIKLNNFKIKIQRLLNEIKCCDETSQKKIFILDKNHQIIYSNKQTSYGFGHIQNKVQILEENYNKNKGLSTLETSTLKIEDLFPKSQLQHAIYEIVIKLKQNQISTLSFPELGFKIEILLDVHRNYQDIYLLYFDIQMLINCSLLFEQIFEKISQKISGNRNSFANKIFSQNQNWLTWENDNQQFIDPSEKSSIYTNDSAKSSFRHKGNWNDTLSGFNKLAKNNHRRVGMKKTSISSNLLNLSIISKHPEAQQSIVMEYVPNFLNQDNESMDEEKDKMIKENKIEEEKKTKKLVIAKSTRNLKNLEYGKSMFFKEPFLPKIKKLKKIIFKKQSIESIEFGPKGYSSNVITRTKRFNTFAKKKLKRAASSNPNDEDQLSIKNEFEIDKNDSMSV